MNPDSTLDNQVAGGTVRQSDIVEPWHFRSTAFERKGTSCAEATARRRIGRRRRIADHGDRAAEWRVARVHGRRRAQEHPRIGMLRPLEQRIDRRKLHDLAEIHHGHAVGDVPHDAEVVAQKQHRQLQLLLQVLQELEDLRADRHIERRDRLVGDEHAGAQRQRARNRDALALAAAELVRIAVDIE